jgi:hypothetical protein
VATTHRPGPEHYDVLVAVTVALDGLEVARVSAASALHELAELMRASDLDDLDAEMREAVASQGNGLARFILLDGEESCYDSAYVREEAKGIISLALACLDGTVERDLDGRARRTLELEREIQHA